MSVENDKDSGSRKRKQKSDEKSSSKKFNISLKMSKQTNPDKTQDDDQQPVHKKGPKIIIAKKKESEKKGTGTHKKLNKVTVTTVNFCVFGALKD